MSSSASRAWITSGRPVSPRGRDMGARKPLRLRVARALVVVIVEPGLADARRTFGCCDSATSSSAVTSSSSCAHVRMGADRAVDRWRSARRWRSSAAKRAHPRRDRHHARRRRRPRRARHERRARSAKSGKSRWQWVSTSIRPASGPPSGFDIAREDAGSAPAAPCRRPARAAVAQRREVALPRRRRASRSSSLADEPGMTGWHQDRDLAHHLGGHVEHRVAARRVGLASAPRAPGRRNSGWPRRPRPRSRRAALMDAPALSIAARALPSAPSAWRQHRLVRRR